MQRGIDAGRARIEVEGAVGQVAHHLVLVRDAAIEALQPVQLVQVECGEPIQLHRAEVAAGALDPQHRDRLAGQRIARLQLGRGVAAAIVGDALVGAQQVRAVEQPPRLVEAGGVGIVPAVLQRCRGCHDRILLCVARDLGRRRRRRQTEPTLIDGPSPLRLPRSREARCRPAPRARNRIGRYSRSRA